MKRSSALLVDIGNSSLKWAICEGRDRTPTERLLHRDGGSAGRLETAWATILGSVDRAFVANVAGPAIGERVRDYLQRAGIAVRELRSEARFLGVSNGYKEPARLGIDRWLALIAAARIGAEEAVCTVDCGSAITLDGLCPDGRHLGGMILPGFRMVAGAFERETRIGSVVMTGGFEIFAKDTAVAVRSGLGLGCVALVEKFRENLGRACQCPARVVLTGSDAPYLLPYLESPVENDPDLVMKGLEIVARNNDDTLADIGSADN